MSGFNTEEFANRWHQMSLAEQMGNIGSEVDRIASWKKKGNEDYAMKALYRSLDLFDLTASDPRWKNRLKEILRAREFLCDLYVGDIAQWNARAGGGLDRQLTQGMHIVAYALHAQDCDIEYALVAVNLTHAFALNEGGRGCSHGAGCEAEIGSGLWP